MSALSTVQTLFSSIDQAEPGPEAAKLVVHENQVLSSHEVPGLHMEASSQPGGLDAKLVVDENVRLESPVHLCFGMLPEKGAQHIELDVQMEPGARASFRAHCTFPNAVEVIHSMSANIVVAAGASYEYAETHVHGPGGGVVVVPKARVIVEKGGRFRTEFALTQGRVGRIDIDYETVVMEDGVLEMLAKIFGRGGDEIEIDERAILEGARSRGVLESYVALRDTARAAIRNSLIARGPHARGHVDCKEIVQDEATASAVPIVDVQHPKAHVTHEAAIGAVDSAQLETLMSRGLTEDDAIDLIIAGMLS
jgi:hypothetical protein